MQVKPGYKQTEVGIIPKDWTESQLGRIATVSAGGTPSRAVPTYWNGNIPWVTTTEIDFGTITETEQHISPLGLRNSAAKVLRPGTLLMALYGQGKTRGKVALLGIEATSNQACAAIVLWPEISNPFVFHFLASRYDAIRGLSNSGSQENLNGVIVKSILIPLPPTKAEQEAIAGALSDADSLIESLEQLVTKKRQIKHGAMQQLLTGQKRLPGFSGEWETKTLHIVLKKGRLGGNYPNQNNESSFPLMKMGNVGRGYFDLSKVEYIKLGIKPEMVHRLMRGDVLFNTRNTLDLVGKVAIWRDELPVAYYNSNLMRLEFDPTQVCSNEYANAALNSERVVSRLREMATGTTSVAAIYTRDLMKLQFVVPPLQEQTAIADVLSAMDAEIVELERKLAKARLVKAGMMQELLTGRIRLA